ncbi:MAG: glutamine--fructose-6-phosphate transaminase (isomerizing) [Candidatus Omnitrophica bacterium]|nr:glutamine--fructose-6-phosphate transaminase (isomerizing) [Candidatus Omnitrophota bacterium]
MCGIVGYVGAERSFSAVLDALQLLEYRGYDSCGIAASISSRSQKKIFSKKIKGKIRELKTQVSGSQKTTLAIAHTRWATHGIPNRANAHPHYDAKKNIFVVHNGIIENYRDIEEHLKRKGYKFVSQTDTEVIPHLIAELNTRYDFYEAIVRAVKQLEGSFAIVLFNKQQDKLYVVKKNSPLIIGVLKDGYFVASDIPAVCGYTNRVINLRDGEIALLSPEKIELFDFHKRKIKPVIERVNVNTQHIDKKHYSHFMLKEIFEQPQVMKNIFAAHVKRGQIDFKDMNLERSYLASLKKIFIVACGTAYHAGFVAKYFMEKYCKIDVEIDVSSEARYRASPIKKDDLVLAISQSGETADTLASVKEAKKRGAKILAICNVLGSSLPKEAHGLIHTVAGPEIGVASTKAYTAQIFSLYLFAIYLAGIRKTIKEHHRELFLNELKKMGDYQAQVLQHSETIRRIAKKFSKFGCFLFLGRGINYPSAMEGALKLKEISYIPAEGYAAGEMKHGPIALIDEYRAVVCIAPFDNLYEKMVSNIQEIKARKGKVLGIVNVGDVEASRLSDEKVYLPCLKNQDLQPLLVALPLQMFAYFVARNLGCEIDQPRNLAKSVTVE